MQEVIGLFDKATRKSRQPHTQPLSLCGGWKHDTSLIANTMTYHICNGTSFCSFTRIAVTANIQQKFFTIGTSQEKHVNTFVLTTENEPDFRHRISEFHPKSHFLAHDGPLHPNFLSAALQPCNFAQEKRLQPCLPMQAREKCRHYIQNIK